MVQNIFFIDSISKNNFEKNIKSSNFVLDYIEYIKPKTYELNIVNKRDLSIKYPIVLEYLDKPEFNGFSILIPELKIIQRWDLLDNLIIIDIDIYLHKMKIGRVNINIIFNFTSNDKVKISITGQWVYKSFLIPSSILENVILETKKFITVAVK